MKEVKAYVQPHKLEDVILALHGVAGLTGMSVTNVKGFGRGRAQGSPVRILEDLDDPPSHARIEIMCRDDVVDDIVGAIETAAHTGLRGDGKIYVLTVEAAVRISTGERGIDAV